MSSNIVLDQVNPNLASIQLTTFYVADKIYGIDVKRVQEVVRPLALTKVPMAPHYLTGLINLRGQIATGIGLRELFGLPPRSLDAQMNVVIKACGVLLSFQVDEIGDVIEVNSDQFEKIPSTINDNVGRFLGGVYKCNNQLLGFIDVDPIASFLGLSSGQSVSGAG